jgi:hypothetical protein
MEEEIYWEEEAEPADTFERDAYKELKLFLGENLLAVYYGRQLEVIFEKKYFHWITNRVLRQLVSEKFILMESRNLKWGGSANLYWYKSNRYFKREANRVINLIERYSVDKIGSSIGRHGEFLVLEGFAMLGFRLLGKNVNEFNGKKWEGSGHNLDLVVERDGIVYGIEVKNTLSYIPKKEFEAKIDMCDFLEVKPVFAVRMLPKNWIQFLAARGGFEGTMKRFEKWHLKYVNRKINSQQSHSK